MICGADFVPYFWFPAPVCKHDGKVVPLDESSLDTITEHLNYKVLASRKKSGVFGDRSVSHLDFCEESFVFLLILDQVMSELKFVSDQFRRS